MSESGEGQGVIIHELQILEKIISDIKDITSQLIEKIGPVLKPTNKVETEKCGDENLPESRLAELIIKNRKKLETEAKNLFDAFKRCEL